MRDWHNVRDVLPLRDDPIAALEPRIGLETEDERVREDGATTAAVKADESTKRWSGLIGG
jgi:hypothetical protein